MRFDPDNKIINRCAAFILLSAILASGCKENGQVRLKQKPNPVIGTWKLLTGTLIDKGDTTVTYYTKKVSFIKIINATHFAFLEHDLDKGRDSAVFVAGGGEYSLNDSLYTEHLQYCSDRSWEGNDFSFTISIKDDTLVLRGIEKVEGTGVNRINTEEYVRMKN